MLPTAGARGQDDWRAWQASVRLARRLTVPLLLEHLYRRTEVRVSDDTLRRQLHRMRDRFKRPRYVPVPDALLEKKRCSAPRNQRWNRRTRARLQAEGALSQPTGAPQPALR